jgi:hypothetical protein
VCDSWWWQGFEDNILRGFLDSVSVAELPLIIHFENKVLAGRDEAADPKTAITAGLLERLRQAGYALYPSTDEEDTLALLVGQEKARAVEIKLGQDHKEWEFPNLYVQKEAATASAASLPAVTLSDGSAVQDAVPSTAAAATAAAGPGGEGKLAKQQAGACTAGLELQNSDKVKAAVAEYASSCGAHVHGTEYCTLIGVGEAMLRAVSAPTDFIITAQVGGMDGKSGDPLAGTPGLFTMHQDQELHGQVKHWAPIVFEPMGYNFKNLTEHYIWLQQKFGLQCTNVMQRAISYPEEKTCSFYEFNLDSKVHEEQHLGEVFGMR